MIWWIGMLLLWGILICDKDISKETTLFLMLIAIAIWPIQLGVIIYTVFMDKN